MTTFEQYLETSKEIGFVDQSIPSLAYLTGLPGAKPHELIIFESGEQGEILSLADNLAEVLVFTKYPIKVGTKATRTNKFLEFPVGSELLGCTLDPFGNLYDNVLGFVPPKNTRRIDIPPPGISSHKRITKPFATGVSVVDLLVPLGHGQRELIIGDRKTGKTNFIMQTIFTQARLGTICIYAAVGKKKLDIKRIEEFFTKNGIKKQVIVIASNSDDPASIIYLTPFCAMTLAEYFKDQGKDVLLVLDDMSMHAKIYREISLLGKRFPGRNAYPGDIFYTHAQLLERAGNFETKTGEASITCLPVVESILGDITGYIQTNLMSMTDGHIYFDNNYFVKGHRPAVNPFVSVTRVGRQTQSTLKQTINRELLSFLTLRERMDNFTHFGAEVSTSIRGTLATGEKVLAFFDQSSHEVYDINLQLFAFGLVWFGLWRGKSNQDMKQDLQKITSAYITNKSFRGSVDEIVTKAESLNSLLGIIPRTGIPLLAQIGIEALLTPGVGSQIPTQAPSTTSTQAKQQPK